MTSSFLSGGIIFSAEALKTVKIDQKLITTIKGTLKWYDNVKIAKKMGKFRSKMQESQNFEKHTCQNTVAMETSNCLDKNVLYQIVVR